MVPAFELQEIVRDARSRTGVPGVAAGLLSGGECTIAADGVLVLGGPQTPGGSGQARQPPGHPGQGEQETPVRPGHVISRPAGTGVAHMFRAGESGLTYLAYGMRHSGDVCYYPRSNKIAFRGLGFVGRLERLDYWDGEG